MQPPNICIHFQRGFCSYGNNCRFLHQQIGGYARGGGRFTGARWTQTQGRGGIGGQRYSYYQESYFQVSATSWSTQPRAPPTREWSAPFDDSDLSQHRSAFNFRFMSWNILAAELAQAHKAELYPHAHQSCLAWPRRLAAVVSHVAEQRPDVLCLQEVDDWPGLSKELSALGYDGVHLQRTGGRGDGCATLWLRDRLCLAGSPRSSSAAAIAKSISIYKSGCGDGDGVHRIRMADHGLKDNVALLVHLIPRPGSGVRRTAGDTSSAGVAVNSEWTDEQEILEEGSNSSGDDGGGDGDGGATAADSSSRSDDSVDDEGPAEPAARLRGQRRPKRTRQSCEGDGEAGSSADAAAAAIASLQSYPQAASCTTAVTAAGLKSVVSAPARLQGKAQPGPKPQPGGSPGGGAAGPLEGRSNSIGQPQSPMHRGLWVANTHVLFNTKRGDIKLGQLRVILNELAARAVEAQAVGTDTEMVAPSLPVIFAGDFNTSPGSGLYRFLRHGAIRLAGHDRRELSGQVEGYGYEQLQRDTRAGFPPRLVRWGPDPQELRNPQEAGNGASAPPPASGGRGTGGAYGVQAARSRPEILSSSENWRPMHQATQQQQQQQQRRQGLGFFDNRLYSVQWQEEELVYAMGRVAVAQTIAALKDAAAAGIGSQGRGGGQGGGREQAAAAGGTSWLAVTEAAVVRHPLQLRSAYAAGDEQEREPLFTTLHARYVGTVDFVWYTPGDSDDDGGGGVVGTAGSTDDLAATAVQAQKSRTSGFRLTPVRVLNPPDPLSYPYGMPCADWPSDHISLVVDFLLS